MANVLNITSRGDGAKKILKKDKVNFKHHRAIDVGMRVNLMLVFFRKWRLRFSYKPTQRQRSELASFFYP